METIRFSMAGSGDWRRWLGDDPAASLYLRIYDGPVHLRQLTDDEQCRVREWLAPGFVAVHDGVLLPRVPILTNSDLAQLTPWLSHVTEAAAAVLREHAGAYRSLANALASQRNIPADYLLTILLCAHTLDIGTLGQLQSGIMGQPPDRAGAGRYFLWGETADLPDRYDFGVNSFPVINGGVISVILSPRVERAMPDLHEVPVPVLDHRAMERVQALCGPVSRQLAQVFTDGLDRLRGCVGACSFADCSAADNLCMLFHFWYGRLTRAMVDRRLLPAFPARPADNWGIWIRAVS